MGMLDVRSNWYVSIKFPAFCVLTFIITLNIAVPLSNRHPANVLDYFIKDSEACLLITIDEFESLLTPLANKHQRPLIVLDHSFIPTTNADQSPLAAWQDIQFDAKSLSTSPRIADTLDNSFYQNANAMIMYTSGSTGQPKGALITHKNIAAQNRALSSAWSITSADSLLHVLPLNHIHGCVNALLTPLSQGARITMLPKYDSPSVWATLLNVNLPSKDRISVFMAVPTIYSLLLAEYDKTFAKNNRMTEFIRAQCEKKIRLMISGSAPLPATVFERWADITGHKLLERYGMTETGMVLSNPLVLDKVRDRVAGTVGAPLAGVETQLMAADGKIVAHAKGETGKGVWSEHELPFYGNANAGGAADEVVGELCVRGDSVFAGYLNRPDETAKAFRNGWFLTGDEAACDANGRWRILGRKSVDIIKSGGHKVSALDIETKLLEIANVADVCVVGLPHETWGQQIAALIETKPDVDEEHVLAALKQFCIDNMAPYERPVEWKFIKEIPRNAMGKVNKKMIIAEQFEKPKEI